MDDFTNKQQVIDVIDQVIEIGDKQLIGFRDDTAMMLTWQLKKDAMNVIKDRIKELPTAEPHWIPCSRELPEVGKLVLVSWNGYMIVDRLATNNGKTYWQCLNSWNVNGSAWMPLPHAYERS